MLITKIIQAKRKADRAHIYLDDKFAAAINKDLIVKYNLFVGKSVTEEEWEEITTLETEQRIFMRLWDYCLRRPRSQRELQRKIKEIELKNEIKLAPDAYARVMEKLASLGFDDFVYAKWLVAQRRAGGKMGQRRIQTELQAQGIDKGIVSQVLADKVDEQVLQEALLQRKFGVTSLKEISDRALKARAYRFLVSRGFYPKL
jgi:regulatory protein